MEELKILLQKILNKDLQQIILSNSRNPEQIQKDEHGLIQAISTTEGVTATELAKLAGAEKIVPVDINHIPQRDHDYCARERWIHHD